MEKWKAIEDVNFNYIEISSTGRLKNSLTGHVYKLRVQKQTRLSFCDVSMVDSLGELHRKTIYIAYEVCNAFVKKPSDFHLKNYKSAHKKGVSKLNNLPQNLCWKTQSDFSKKNMQKYPANRTKLAKQQKNKFAKIRAEKAKQITIPKKLLNEVYALIGAADYKSAILKDKAIHLRSKIYNIQHSA